MAVTWWRPTIGLGIVFFRTTWWSCYLDSPSQEKIQGPPHRSGLALDFRLSDLRVLHWGHKRGWDVTFSRVHVANRIDQFFGRHALQEISPGSCIQGALDLPVTRKCRQND